MSGGSAPAALARRAFGRWLLAGGVRPAGAYRAYITVVEAQQGAGRTGMPRFVELVWYALDPDAEIRARRYLLEYCAALGDDAPARVAAAQIATSAQAVRQLLDEHSAVAMDELVFLPGAPEADLAVRLAENLA